MDEVGEPDEVDDMHTDPRKSLASPEAPLPTGLHKVKEPPPSA